MTIVPFLDLGAGYLELKNELDDAIERVASGGCYIGGETLCRFESNFALFCEAKHAIGVGNGLDALTLCLMALDLSPGDEVIVPAHTFIATWLAVVRCGLRPVPVEPIEDGYNIDPSLIEAAISDRTRVIMPVHLYGQPVDISAINQIAQKHQLYVIEDAAQAHGAQYRGKKIGAHGTLVAWSFYPGKNLGAMGDGGAITTDDTELAMRIRELSNYGSREKYIHNSKGINSRLDPIQAAVLDIKLTRLNEWNARRNRIAQTYLEALSDTPIEFQKSNEHSSSSWHLFVIKSLERDKLKEHLSHSGISTLIHYPIPPHKQMAFQDLNPKQTLTRTETISKQILSLPIGPHMTNDEQDYVIQKIHTFFCKAR